MKIVNIIGGLGNQMFQYAFALSLRNKFPEEEILIDISHFNYLFLKKLGASNLHNGYEVDKIFHNAKLKVASPLQLLKVTWFVPNYFLSRVVRKFFPQRKTEIVLKEEDNFVYHPFVYDIKGNCYYEGVWESISNYLPIQAEIQNVFAHPSPDTQNLAYIKKMESSNSVGIHVRRGDYLKEPSFRGICEIDYYERAIKEILRDGKSHTFYIFSNDFDWCESNLLNLLKNLECVFVNNNTGTNSCWDMFLMSHCQDLVIANSSFSWWGAFLNRRGGRVIAPNKWTNRAVEHDVWAPEWIRM